MFSSPGKISLCERLDPGYGRVNLNPTTKKAGPANRNPYLPRVRKTRMVTSIVRVRRVNRRFRTSVTKMSKTNLVDLNSPDTNLLLTHFQYGYSHQKKKTVFTLKSPRNSTQAPPKPTTERPSLIFTTKTAASLLLRPDPGKSKPQTYPGRRRGL